MQRRSTAPLSVAFEAAENIATNVSANPTLGDMIAERLSRRDLVQGMLAVSLDDHRLTWPERELVQQIGEKLYGKREDPAHG